MNHVLTILQPAQAGYENAEKDDDLGPVPRASSSRPGGARSGLAEPAWNSAQFLELLPPKSTTPAEGRGAVFSSGVPHADQKITGYDKSHRAKGWENPKGGGKGKEGQKGENGKGKEKKGRASSLTSREFWTKGLKELMQKGQRPGHLMHLAYQRQDSTRRRNPE